MHCLNCNAANPDNHRFCEGCGASFSLPVIQACPACGYACGLSAKFCGGCGIALDRRDGALVAKAQAAPPSDVWGELKQATVLFADIVGSTEHIAALDPEQAMEHLRPVIHSMCDAVERYGGTVIRTLGDGIMALFGVPKSLEGHAVLACEAALIMQAGFQHAPAGLQVRVGLHSGQVASDPHDAKGGRGGGAHGLTIHLASRVVALAQPGGVCMTGATKALLGQTCRVLPMGDYPLKGIIGLTPIFELLGMANQQPDAAGSQWVSPFHGRSLEIDILLAALARAQAGDARVVGISAEPGGGKSRLCQEFVQRCRSQGLQVCEVRAQLYGHATPLQPVLELLRNFYFCIAATDTPDIARTRIAQRLQALQASSDDVELMAEFLGVAAPDAAASPLSPRAKHQRMLELLRLLVRDDAGTSTVLLLEDLHWLDEASEAFVATLVDAVAGTHTLVVMNYRPHYTPAWAQAPHFTRLDLPDLAAADMHSLVAGLLGTRPELAEVCKLVVARSAGNPFFAEELAHTLIDSALLAGLECGLPPGRLEQIEHALPATVQAVIGAKVDQLGEPEKTLLQMCAIIGKEIPMAVIEQVASPLRAVLERGLAGLRQAGLILQQPDQATRQFVFRHPIIQEVTYGMQLKVRRVSLHGAVAQAMEAFYRDRLDEFAGLIAYHYEAAQAFLRAAEYTSRSARWIGGTDSAQAIKLWHKVRDLLQDQVRESEVDRLRAMACSKIVFLGWRQGLTIEAAQPLIDEAVCLAQNADPRLIELLLFVEGRMGQANGGPADMYVRKMHAAISLQERPRGSGRATTLHAALCQAYGWAGLLREALSANDVGLAGVRGVERFDQEFVGFSIEQWLLGMRGRLLVRMGRFNGARECLQQVLNSGDPNVDPVLLQIAHWGYVELGGVLGDAVMAQSHASMAVGIAAVNGSPYMRVLGLCCVATAKRVARDYKGALQALLAALDVIRGGNVAMEFETELLASVAECHSHSDEIELVIAVADETIALSRQRNSRIPECRALIVKGNALLKRNGEGDVVAATRLFELVASLIELTGASIYAGLLNRAGAEGPLRPILGSNAVFSERVGPAE
ncbi:AAA family ATPase [Rhodoferax sp.]|uniref:AAA family ATPase n=1 Tax=Rhodoferax sp. TaxID=50421 RepID=UPI0027672493|nr:adenylate/guanylate cyclase domain-containing protein [Rhodoferax sp.]